MAVEPNLKKESRQYSGVFVKQGREGQESSANYGISFLILHATIQSLQEP